MPIGAFRSFGACRAAMESADNPLIIGAGPAGLTAALQLAKRGMTPRIYEASGDVGGLARTPTRRRLARRSRRSPILHQKQGGLRAVEVSTACRPVDLGASALRNARERSLCAVPACRSRSSVADGVSKRNARPWRFLVVQTAAPDASELTSRRASANGAQNNSAGIGTRLFFDGYVRKTWLTDPEDLASDWANQRIKPISWRTPSERDPKSGGAFRYPRHGPGQLWEAAAQALAKRSAWSRR